MTKDIDVTDIKSRGVCPTCSNKCTPRSPVELMQNTKLCRSNVSTTSVTECIVTSRISRYVCNKCNTKWTEIDDV